MIKTEGRQKAICRPSKFTYRRVKVQFLFQTERNTHSSILFGASMLLVALLPPWRLKHKLLRTGAPPSQTYPQCIADRRSLFLKQKAFSKIQNLVSSKEIKAPLADPNLVSTKQRIEVESSALFEAFDSTSLFLVEVWRFSL